MNNISQITAGSMKNRCLKMYDDFEKNINNNVYLNLNNINHLHADDNINTTNIVKATETKNDNPLPINNLISNLDNTETTSNSINILNATNIINYNTPNNHKKIDLVIVTPPSKNSVLVSKTIANIPMSKNIKKQTEVKNNDIIKKINIANDLDKSIFEKNRITNRKKDLSSLSNKKDLSLLTNAPNKTSSYSGNIVKHQVPNKHEHSPPIQLGSITSNLSGTYTIKNVKFNKYIIARDPTPSNLKGISLSDSPMKWTIYDNNGYYSIKHINHELMNQNNTKGWHIYVLPDNKEVLGSGSDGNSARFRIEKIGNYFVIRTMYTGKNIKGGSERYLFVDNNMYINSFGDKNMLEALWCFEPCL
jgi:hypothetical protein